MQVSNLPQTPSITSAYLVRNIIQNISKNLRLHDKNAQRVYSASPPLECFQRHELRSQQGYLGLAWNTMCEAPFNIIKLRNKRVNRIKDVTNAGVASDEARTVLFERELAFTCNSHEQTR